MSSWKSLFDKWEISEAGEIRCRDNSRLVKVRLRRDGYLDLKLNNKNYLVHRLVAIVFIPNPLNLPQVNHLDGKRDNAHRSNLEWVDQFGNMRHAFANGLFPSRKGARNSRAIITEETAREIKDLLAKGHKSSDLARKFGVTYDIVSNIKNKKAWSWL